MDWRSRLVVVMTILAAAATPLRAQQPMQGWGFGVGGFAVAWPNDGSTIESLAGPALQASWFSPHGLGFDARVGYFVDTGFYGASGLSGIVGATYGIPVGTHLFQAKAGGTGFFGGDSDGTVHGGGGPYGGLGMTFRVAGRFGIQAEALGRVYKTSGGWSFAPSGAVTLMLLPR